MIEDLAGTLKKRIVAVAAEEYPGCTVAFEDEREDFIHFHINRPDGESISGGSPPYLAVDIADWPEEKFRYVFRQVCGK